MIQHKPRENHFSSHSAHSKWAAGSKKQKNKQKSSQLAAWLNLAQHIGCICNDARQRVVAAQKAHKSSPKRLGGEKAEFHAQQAAF